MSVKKTIMDCVGSSIYKVLAPISEDFFNDIREIRIRIGKPIIILHIACEYFVTSEGKPTKTLCEAYCADERALNDCVKVMSGYSLYAFEEELKNGYITLSGGHRVGICGRAVANDRKINTITDFNGINIRICKEVTGCADKIYSYVTNPYINNTMIISPPGAGKTTMLRDLIRLLSDKGGQTVGVVDERSEIAGCFRGIPQNDVGIRTDVIDCCPKEEGMLMLLRAMGPTVIAVDEIGKRREIEAIEEIAGAGIRFICSVHGYSLSDVIKKPYMEGLLNKKIFSRYIILNREKIGEVMDIYDENFQSLAL